MRMTGEERIAAPRDRAWEALNDPDVLRQCIPGCVSLEREDADRLRALVQIKIGPIGARFNSVVRFAEVDPPRGYQLIVESQGGTVGSAKSSLTVRLAEDSQGTRLSYEVEAQLGGRLAQLGGPLIDATAKQLAAQFFRRFGEIIAGPRAAGAGTDPGADADADADAGVGVGPPELRADSARPDHAQFSAATPAGSAASTGSPVAWILALVVAALVGFLFGRAQGGAGGSDWMGLALGLLLIIVAAAAFEFGRRTAAPPIVLDAALLRRLLREARP